MMPTSPYKLKVGSIKYPTIIFLLFNFTLLFSQESDILSIEEHIVQEIDTSKFITFSNYVIQSSYTPSFEKEKINKVLAFDTIWYHTQWAYSPITVIKNYSLNHKISSEYWLDEKKDTIGSYLFEYTRNKKSVPKRISIKTGENTYKTIHYDGYNTLSTKSVRYPNNPLKNGHESYFYSKDKRLIKIERHYIKNDYKYDYSYKYINGLVSSVTGFSNKIYYSSENTNSLTSRKDTLGVYFKLAHYTYDDQSRLSKQTLFTKNSTNRGIPFKEFHISYDTLNRIESVTINNLTKNPRGLRKEIAVKTLASISNLTDVEIVYKYDEMGKTSQLLLLDDTKNQINSVSFVYSYDSKKNWIELKKYIDDKLDFTLYRKITYR